MLISKIDRLVPSDGVCSVLGLNQSDPREIGVSGGLAQGDVGSMDSSKVPSRSVASELGRLLESPEIAGLIESLEATRWTGRPGYPIRTMIGVMLAKTLYAIPTWTRTVALIQEHAALRATLGCWSDDEVPSIDACYRFTAKLRKHKDMLDQCISGVIGSLHEQLPDLGKNVAIDASDMPAYANGKSFTFKSGQDEFSDPDASWGHRSGVSTRGGGNFFGYKLHLAVDTATDIPLAWMIETGRTSENKTVAPLLDELHEREINPETCAMDKGYDYAGVHFDCMIRGIDPVIPLRQTPDVKRGDDRPPDCDHGIWRFAGADRKRGATKWRCPTGECDTKSIWIKANRLKPLIPRETPRWEILYRKRGAVERAFGRLKNECGLTPLRVRKIERVKLHADLTILTKLSCELGKVRQSEMRRAA
jgi:transposase, IS5 family